MRSALRATCSAALAVFLLGLLAGTRLSSGSPLGVTLRSVDVAPLPIARRSTWLGSTELPHAMRAPRDARGPAGLDALPAPLGAGFTWRVADHAAAPRSDPVSRWNRLGSYFPTGPPLHT